MWWVSVWSRRYRWPIYVEFNLKSWRLGEDVVNLSVKRNRCFIKAVIVCERERIFFFVCCRMRQTRANSRGNRGWEKHKNRHHPLYQTLSLCFFFSNKTWSVRRTPCGESGGWFPLAELLKLEENGSVSRVCKNKRGTGLQLEHGETWCSSNMVNCDNVPYTPSFSFTRVFKFLVYY